MRNKEYVAISEEVARKLNAHLEKFCYKRPEFKKISKEYNKKRIHLNAIQFYAGFKASNSKEDFEKFYNIPIAIECVMLMAYKTNRVLDYKQEVWSSEEKIKETVLDEKMYLSLILELLEDSKNTLGDKYNLIRDILLGFISEINKGFWYEKEYLNVNFSSLNDILKNWEVKYKRRNVLFNHVYDYSPLVGFYLGSGDKSIFEKYEKYFKDKDNFSHLGQIINDLSDYSSVYDENVKSYQDAFSDIRNGIITQPTFEIIKEKLILDALKNSKLTKDINWRKKAMDLLLKKEIPEKIRKLTEESYKDNINFWKKIVKVESELLFSTYSLLLNNKYYSGFINLKKHIEK